MWYYLLCSYLPMLLLFQQITTDNSWWGRRCLSAHGITLLIGKRQWVGLCFLKRPQYCPMVLLSKHFSTWCCSTSVHCLRVKLHRKVVECTTHVLVCETEARKLYVWAYSLRKRSWEKRDNEKEVIHVSSLKERMSRWGGGRQSICVNSNSDEPERIHYCCWGT